MEFNYFYIAYNFKFQFYKMQQETRGIMDKKDEVR